MWSQISSPRDDVKSEPGWCLWFAQEVWQVPHQYATAWDAWQATQFKHEGRDLPDVCVPVWFDHWGTYGDPPRYGQYGHVVTYFPGRGFLSSPGRNYGQEWLATIEAVERRFNSTFVGWSEDMRPGVRVVEQVEDDEVMAQGAFFRNESSGAILWQEKPNTVLIPLSFVTWTGYATNGNKFQNISDADYKSLIAQYGTAPVPPAGGTVNVPDFKISMSGEAVKK
jgi:hypothetical protein